MNEFIHYKKPTLLIQVFVIKDVFSDTVDTVIKYGRVQWQRSTDIAVLRIPIYFEHYPE